MGILDLIFDNIYVVIVVLFAVFKVVGSFSRNNKPTRMPTFGGDQQNQWDDEDELVEKPSSYSPNSRETVPQIQKVEPVQTSESVRHAAERVRKQPEPVAQSFEDIKREQQRRQQLAQQRVAAAQKLVASPAKSSQLGSKDLREAVIWSEILGQPRAKRPYRR